MSNTSDRMKEDMPAAAVKVADTAHNVAEKVKDVAHHAEEKLRDAGR